MSCRVTTPPIPSRDRGHDDRRNTRHAWPIAPSLSAARCRRPESTCRCPRSSTPPGRPPRSTSRGDPSCTPRCAPRSSSKPATTPPSSGRSTATSLPGSCDRRTTATPPTPAALGEIRSRGRARRGRRPRRHCRRTGRRTRRPHGLLRSERHHVQRVFLAADIARLMSRVRIADPDLDPALIRARVDELKRLIGADVRAQLDIAAVPDIEAELQDVDFLEASRAELEQMRAAIRPIARKLAARLSAAPPASSWPCQHAPHDAALARQRRRPDRRPA